LSAGVSPAPLRSTPATTVNNGGLEVVFLVGTDSGATVFGTGRVVVGSGGTGLSQRGAARQHDLLAATQQTSAVNGRRERVGRLCETTSVLSTVTAFPIASPRMAMTAPDPPVSTAARTADVTPMAGVKLINENIVTDAGLGAP
jgi:hypothetical protein